jgi:ferredoxin--NADP+ reductase
MFKIVKHQRLVPNIYLMEIDAPEVAEQVQPGQFVIIRYRDGGERIPLSVADWDRKAGTVTIAFMEVGASTGNLARLKAGDSLLTFAGPLGKPTAIAGEGQVLCVAGCYGIASMFPIVRALHEAGAEVTVALEGRAKFLLYWEDRMRAFAKRVFTITRDGSSGQRGHVTSLPEMLQQAGVTPSRVMVNGCTFLLSLTSTTLAGLGVPITVSLNPIMIDGTGMCGVCRVNVGGQRKFACVDGPDFDGREVDWQGLLARRKHYMDEEAYLCHRASCARKG